jgi:hypothetical protein
MKLFSGKRAVIGLLAVAAVMMLPLVAGATIFTDYLSLGTANSALTGTIGPWADVAVELNTDTDTAKFTFQTLSTYQFTDGEAIAVNLRPTFTAPDSISTTNISGGSLTLNLQDGSGNVDGFGVFNVRYTSGNSSAAYRFTHAEFIVSNVDAVSIADLFAPTYDKKGEKLYGYFAGAHIGLPGSATTGFVADGDQGVYVPLPPSALLLGSGLLGLGLVGWRRKKA